MKSMLVAMVGMTALNCGGGVTKENLPQETLRAFCELYARCGVFSSVQSCTQSYGQLFGFDSGHYDKAIAQGKIKFDSAAAGRCVRAYASASCSLETLYRGVAEDCRLIYVGQVPVGQACGLGECVPDAFCTTEVDGKCGTCKARLPVGAAANSPTECAAGLLVINGICARPITDGSACNPSVIPGLLSECASGLTCSAETRVCAKPKSLGDACNDAAACGGFFNCANGSCAKAGVVGTSCAPSSTLSGPFPCQLDLFCDGSTQTCQSRRSEGAPCSSPSSPLSPECSSALRCIEDGTSASCQKPRSAGQSCDDSSVCAPALYCDPSSRLCKERLALGAACTSSDSCIGGSCTSNVCDAIMVATACF